MTIAEQAINDSELMLSLLRDWARAGWIRWLDAELADFLYQQTDSQQPAPALLLLAAALTSHQSGHGHVCLDLQYCLQEPDRALALPPDHASHTPDIRPASVLSCITLPQWLNAIRHPLITGSGTGNSPLVLSVPGQQPRPMLYLRRFWQYEQQIREAIQQRLLHPAGLDDNCLQEVLDELFPGLTIPVNWQKIACALAARSRFSIITGGPGTGKTTTVVRLLAALNRINPADQKPLRIRLAAPTGKAAVRLSESIRSQLDELRYPDNIPTEVSTVHRLLGPVHNSRFFRHNGTNPLPADVVVIDEASMVDVELMAQLMDALPSHARLILLGDKDQLASVEAGAVLGSLCERAEAGNYTPDTANWLKKTTGGQSVPTSMTDASGLPLDQAVTMLRYSHRFGQIPGIGALAQAVNQNADNILALFDGRYAELAHLTLRSTRDQKFEQLILNNEHGYGDYLQLVRELPAQIKAVTDVAVNSATRPDTRAILDNLAKAILQAFGRFQLLAALRKGEFGVEELNLRIESILRNEPQQQSHEWYAGRPVMLTRNDYALKLMNGDIGIALPYPDAGADNSRLRVAFMDSSHANGIRWVLPSRLQSIETVYAMTVHKSQGSEFRHTALILPPYDNPILTRELVYTAITRASGQFTLLDVDPDLLKTAASRRVFRVSGLVDSAQR
tara:strand:- start:56723 stop:58753 length:2031 start_codon:yes stop_codon:yes gene_type:complete